MNPASEFQSEAKPVFVVFLLYQHFQSFGSFDVCYPEGVPELDPQTVVARDAALIATEDESGYLKFFPPTGGWKPGKYPGKYRVEIHVGEQMNNISLMGTMRFTILPPNLQPISRLRLAERIKVGRYAWIPNSQNPSQMRR